jgi:outer membrane protease
MPLSRRVVVPSLLFLLLATVLGPVPAAADGISVEVTTRAGVLFGLARELVYSGSFTISELNWRFQPVAYAGTALSVETQQGLVATVEVRSAFAGSSGKADDSDYLNYEFNGDPSLTHYSEHDCYTERAILLDARLGWAFRLGSRFRLEPFLALSLMQFKWSARDGYLQRPGSGPPYTLPVDKEPVSGTAIIYQQTYLIEGLGVQLAADFAERFDLMARLWVSPYLFCNSLDNHVLTWFFPESAVNYDYYDYLRGGILVEPTVSLGFRPVQRARLSLDVSYRGIFRLIGDTEVVKASPYLPPGEVAETYPDGAGASYNALDVSLTLSLTL